MSIHRIVDAGPPRGITPSRAPSEGRHSKGTAREPGTETISMAFFMSKATGRSMKMTSEAVMAKSCIIVGTGMSTFWLVVRVPEGSST